MVVVPPAIRAAPAVLFTLLLGLLSFRSFALSPLLDVTLLLALHPLYYWTLFRPALFPLWAAFFMGFAIDLSAHELLGLNAFLFVLAALIVAGQRRYLLSQPFATQWVGFALVALCVELARWLVMMLVNWTLFSPAGGLIAALLGAVLYPGTSFVMTGCLRLVAPRALERRL